MAYNNDTGWTELVRNLQNPGRVTKNATIAGEEAYQEWQSFRNSRDNTTIAAELSPPRTELEVQEMDAGYSVFHEDYLFMTNGAVSQGDRMFALRKFT